MAMEEADDFNALVFDCGSSSMKIGYAGDIAPMYVVPSCIAANKREKKKFVGSIRDGLSPKDFLFENPIEKGQIVNWDDMMLMWEHAFGLLKIESTSKPVLLTESPLNCITNREKMVSVMFEKFKVPSLHISNASSLPLYATGRSTGIVLDCGDGLSAVVPTFEGSDMPPANERLNLAGAGVTDYLKQLLSNSYRTDIVQHIKEQVSYVPINFEKEMERPPAAVNYTLPDGKNILIGNERFMCTESLFVPSLTSMNLPEEGIHQLLHKSILKVLLLLNIKVDYCSAIKTSAKSCMQILSFLAAQRFYQDF